MDSQLDKLNERLDFYMKAYDETSGDLKSSKSRYTTIEKEINTEAQNILDEVVPDPLSDNQIDSLEKEYQMNLDDIISKHEEIKSNYIKEGENLKSDSRYKEYLNLLINDDLELVSQMEKDEAFVYLIEQNFGTDYFENQPYFIIFGFKYQPRFWKFKKVADKKAHEFGISSFDEMYQLWKGLRINYQSLIGNKKIADVIKECEEIESKIKSLNKAVEDYLNPRRDDIINAIIQRIKITDVPEQVKSKFSNLVPILEEFNEVSKQVSNLENRNTIIMNNVNGVEKMITLAEQGNLVLDEKSAESFFNNSNPETPIFEMISNEEWTSIKKALEDKGIKTTSKSKYSVVRKQISQEEKDDLLKKYNVKEGEIFIDPDLVNQ
ncbi:hypothetical protein [Aminipila terrae]|uniref:Uncharacterized protein n=1 Tax=Aminipila terrae TaxID=2697030 RepID=A0A6P1MGM2_9FIRM|nr:hypothetical protein [Aminipila terrae]QHI73850.1 hypothetical protein Ami3637_16970 [Aminipila terrae]